MGNKKMPAEVEFTQEADDNQESGEENEEENKQG